MKKITFLLAVLSLGPAGFSQTTTIDCTTFGDADTFEEYAFTLYHVEEELGEYNGCSSSPAFMVAVIDPTDGCTPWGTYFDAAGVIYNPDYNFGNFNNEGGCRERVENHFVFRQNSADQLDSLNQMLLHKIPNGYHVLVYSWIGLDADLVAANGPELVTTFNDLGWADFDLGLGNVPFIMYGEIGSTDFTQEVYGSAINDTLYLEQTFECDLISYVDTMTVLDVDIGEDSVGTGDGGLVTAEIAIETADQLNFTVTNNVIKVTAETGIEDYEVTGVYDVSGRNVAFTTNQDGNTLYISIDNHLKSVIVLNLINENGSNQVRKLIPINGIE